MVETCYPNGRRAVHRTVVHMCITYKGMVGGEKNDEVVRWPEDSEGRVLRSGSERPSNAQNTKARRAVCSRPARDLYMGEVDIDRVVWIS